MAVGGGGATRGGSSSDLPGNVTVGGLSSVDAYIIWTTMAAVNGSVIYGLLPSVLDRVAYDSRGEGTLDTTHICHLTLEANTTFYYKLVSNGTVYGHVPDSLKASDTGEPWSLTAFQTVDLYGSFPFIVEFCVNTSDGKAANGVLGTFYFERDGHWSMFAVGISDSKGLIAHDTGGNPYRRNGSIRLNLAVLRLTGGTLYEHQVGDRIHFRLNGGVRGVYPSSTTWDDSSTIPAGFDIWLGNFTLVAPDPVLDTTPPLPPTLVDLQPDWRGLDLSWLPSPSTDLGGYAIYAYDPAAGFDAGNPLFMLPSSATRWNHTRAMENKDNVVYMVRAYDTSYNLEGNGQWLAKSCHYFQLGWNLVNMPLNRTDLLVGDLAVMLSAEGIDVAIVSAWGPGGWDSWISILPWINNYSIEPGKAMFIQVKSEGWWIPEGELVTRPLAQDIDRGWNAIAAPRHSWATQKASDIEAQVNAQVGADTVVYVINWTGSDWEYYHKGTGTDFSLDDVRHMPVGNVRGWFLCANKSGTWNVRGDLDHVEVEPVSAVMSPGEQQQFVVTSYDVLGNVIPNGEMTFWWRNPTGSRGSLSDTAIPDPIYTAGTINYTLEVFVTETATGIVERCVAPVTIG